MAICNWRSTIGKHALMWLTKIFAAEPFKNSKTQHKEYVENELRDLSYIYWDPLTKVKGLFIDDHDADTYTLVISLEHIGLLH